MTRYSNDASTNSLIGSLWQSRYILIAALSLLMIAVHLLLRLRSAPSFVEWPLWIGLAFGGIPLIAELMGDVLHRKFGSDLLAGISIVTAVILGEYLAGLLVVLMLSGGEALESYAVAAASSALQALSKRMPSVAHRQVDGAFEDVSLDVIEVGEVVRVFPHEICPVDGVVVEGHGSMDESYLTGEPYVISKASGASVLSGAINGDTALAIRADKKAIDSRYARIMEVMRESEGNRPRIRRLADRLGAIYTPVAVLIAVVAWLASGEPTRFLAVMVVATPCPLLIAIPVAIIGSISLAAKRAIIIRNPGCLETADRCRTLIFDKTGTLTYGRPELTDVLVPEEGSADRILALVASLERYSKHPLAEAIVKAATKRKLVLKDAQEVSEKPGEGLRGRVDSHAVRVTSRRKLGPDENDTLPQLPPAASGLECIVLVDGRYAATLRLRDTPRPDGRSFIEHLARKHGIEHTMLVSGDRKSEVEYLAKQVGISEVFYEQSPEQKLEIVREQTRQGGAIFVGDGINDAPALAAATVGLAFGQNSDVTTEAADAVVMDSSLRKVDEFLHISRRMRVIALQSAVGGIAASVVAMLFAAAGFLSPVLGAVLQEVIDVVSVLNALRASAPPATLIDFEMAPPQNASP